MQSLSGIYRNGNSLSKSIERLSTGLRINNAKDDPAGMGIGNLLNAQRSGAMMALKNAHEAQDLLNATMGGLNEIEELVMKGRDVVVRSYNAATMSDADRIALQAELDGILKGIDDIANSSTFNNKSILNGGEADKTTLDSQADWQASPFANNPAGSIDLLSSPGDVKLDTVDWVDSSGTYYGNALAAGADNYITVYLSGVSRDPVTGLQTADVNVEFNSTNNRNFNGSISFDGSTTINSVAGPGTQAGNNVNYNFTVGPGGKQTFSVNITAPGDANWDLSMNNPTNSPGVSLYFDSTKLYGPKLGAWSVPNNYYTTIEPNGDYYSEAIDMEATGGEASLIWQSSQPGGTTLSVRVEESATGVGGWSALPLVESGETFDYNQRYLRVVIEMTSAGIAFGSPSVDWVELSKVEPTKIQAGADNKDSHRINFTSIDARASALGIAGLNILSNTNIAAQFDTSAEMLAGFKNLNNIDILSDPGYYQLESPIANSGTAAGAAGNNWFTVDYVVTSVNTDGTYDIEVNLNTYGESMGGDAGLYYFGNFRFMDGEGGPIAIDSVSPISHEGGGNWGDSYVANGPVGAYTDVDFEHRTAGLTDGLKFNLSSVDPDIRWVSDFDVRGINGGVPSANYHYVDIYNGSTQIGFEQGAGAGSFNVDRRLAEFNIPGSFETSAIKFGEDAEGFLTGVSNNPGDYVQYRVEQSMTGVGGWVNTPNQIDYGDGNTSFKTDPGYDFIRVLVQVNGDAEAFAPGNSGTPMTYTESSSPRMNSLVIGRNSIALVLFDNAIEKLSDKQSDVATAYRELTRQIDALNQQVVSESAALSRIRDADMAREAVSMTKSQLLNSSATGALYNFGASNAGRASTLLGVLGNPSPFLS